MESNDEVNLPQWFKELEKRVRDTYLDLIKTSCERSKQHEAAVKALDEAVLAAQRLTLDYLQHLKQLNTSQEINEEISNNTMV